MNNKRFIIIFSILVLIIIGMTTYSLVSTIKIEKEDNNSNISIEDLNDIILKSSNFNTSKVSEISKDDLTKIFGIEETTINKFYGKKSVLNTDSSLYILIEPKENMQDEIYSKLEKFGLEYEKEWSNYLEAEYDIVVSRKIGKIGKYIYLVISDDSYDIIKEIKNNEKYV